MHSLQPRLASMWLLALLAVVGAVTGLAEIAGLPVFLSAGHEHPLSGGDFGAPDGDSEETLENEDPKDPIVADVRCAPPGWLWTAQRRLDDEASLLSDRLAVSRLLRPPRST